ncbi:MAG: thiosulfohydrolase SoxB, partial [Methylococcales bacterium]|nr:thiosulfohydrolase SoxB [Methylococcales bacterium]
MQRRQFLHALAALGLCPALSRGFSAVPETIYQLPNQGQARLLHFTDVHAQLLPLYYREPTHKNFGFKIGSRQAHAFTNLDFVNAAKQFGKMGGMAHLATLINQLRAQSGAENTLLLDGGDSWQGSATALWTKGQD